MLVFLVIAGALALDWILGEPKRFHPLVFFGTIAQALDDWTHRPSKSAKTLIWRGTFLWAALVVLPAALLWAFLWLLPLPAQVAVELIIVYFSLGWQSMQQHAMDVYRHLQSPDLQRARQAAARILSRETKDLDAAEIAKGTVEAVVENASDSTLSVIFWHLLLGAPGALMFRLANTLDAMWGHKTQRYLHFGRCAARLDDALNWIPARLTVVSFALGGRFFDAIECARNQKAPSEGPNAGLVMAAGGGALNVCLGGPAIYDGVLDERPILGTGRPVESQDIVRSIQLVWRAIAIWMTVLGIALILISANTLLAR